MAPVWTVALATTAAALAAALGAVPVAGAGPLPRRALGWANALAAGLMLGAAFVLAEEGLGLRPWAGIAGVLGGIGVVVASHVFLGVEEEALATGSSGDPVHGGRVLAVHIVHGALEGVAVGVGATLYLGLGIFLALGFALHNVAEGAVLCDVLRRVGVLRGRSAVLAVISNTGQVLLAVATFALVMASPGITSVALGVATGSLVYLTVVELLPEAYELAGKATIALVTTLMMGVILLLRETLLR